jgi:hypothetical protein
MQKEDSNYIGTLALNFINHTYRNIFLTGGAGTGKTTFLKFLKGHTHKKMAIAAPTGVAAVNAGGVTIHSLFGLPPRPLDNATVANIRLAGQDKLLLRELELLVIDEASMLRADVLDAMDYLLQEVRQDARPLGGLQVVFIGDLFQLPPIESQEDLEKLAGQYLSMYFTDSRVYATLELLTIELTEIYRQSDSVFINLLAAVRKGTMSDRDISLLNELYCPDWAQKDAIVLTTHNKSASQLNEHKLSNLVGVVYTFTAEIEGEFSQDQFPVNGNLYLKIGCRVMVIKNDYSTTPQYYNGKIGMVVAISDQKIDVKFDDSTTVAIFRETWSNVSYSINGDNNSVKEIIIGTFKQFPIRLAWAITVHKSQGLTFEKAIIDVADAFAPGQVYVALSRIRTLAGIFLKSKISSSVIISSPHKEKVLQLNLDLNRLAEVLHEEQKIYMKDFLLKVFDLQHLKSTVDRNISNKPTLKILRLASEKLEKYAASFSKEIAMRIASENNSDWRAIANRLVQAESYFINEINATCITPLKEFIKNNKDDFKFRGDVNLMKNYVKLFQETSTSISSSKKLVKTVAEGIIYSPTDMEMTSAKRAESIKPMYDPQKSYGFISTEAQSLELFLIGKSILEIAITRRLGVPAIEAHLASYIPTGEVKLSDIVSQEIIDEIWPLLKEMKTPSIAQLRPAIGGKLSMGQLQALSTYLKDRK